MMGKQSQSADLQPVLRAILGKLKAERRRPRPLPFCTGVNCVRSAQRFQATSVDVGPQGMQLEVKSLLELGAELEVRFERAIDEPFFSARASGPHRGDEPDGRDVWGPRSLPAAEASPVPRPAPASSPLGGRKKGRPFEPAAATGSTTERGHPLANPGKVEYLTRAAAGESKVISE